MVVTLAVGFLFGCFIGSFLNVCAHRLPRAESVVQPGSRCYSCGTPVQWYDNLPIVSWLVLRGRCRWCGSRFSVRYLLIEVLCGLLTAATLAYVFEPAWSVPGCGQAAYGLPLCFEDGWRQLGLTAQPQAWMAAAGQGLAAAALLIVVWYLLVSSLIDIDHMIIPDELTKGLQPLAPFLAIPLLPLVGTTYTMWPLQGWMLDRRLDGSMQLHLDTAVMWVGGISLVVALLLLASLPLARHIYSRCVPEEQRWRDGDHRAFAIGLRWFLVALLPALLLLLGLGLSAGAQPALWRIWLVLVLGQALLGSLCGWLLPYVVGLGGTVVFRRNAMGYGDVKFLAPLGAVLGPIGVIYAFLAAACLGTFVGVPLRLLGRGREIPFGPYLAGGALIALVVGARLHGWIFGSLFHI